MTRVINSFVFRWTRTQLSNERRSNKQNGGEAGHKHMNKSRSDQKKAQNLKEEAAASASSDGEKECRRQGGELNIN